MECDKLDEVEAFAKVMDISQDWLNAKISDKNAIVKIANMLKEHKFIR